MMILDLYRQGLSVSAIARQLGVDRKTVRKYIACGLEPPTYGPRQPRPRRLDAFTTYLRERTTAYPGLTASRLWREIKELGYTGGYTAVTDYLRAVRPREPAPFEVRSEPPPGHQAQVDFAQFQVVFTDEPTTTRIVWLFSMVFGHSRLIWARFVLHQDLQTVLRCHMAAFADLGGVPAEILYDRMKTAVAGQDERATSSTIRRSWPSRAITAFGPEPAGPTGPRRRAKSSGRSATSARTSSSPARFATLTTSMRSWPTGSTA